MREAPESPLVADSPLTWLLAQLATRSPSYWRGSVGELHAELVRMAAAENVDPRELPAAPNALSRALRTRRRLLSIFGLGFSLMRTKRGAQVTVTRMHPRVATVERPPASRQLATAKPR
jgi:hypothetical protein